MCPGDGSHPGLTLWSLHSQDQMCSMEASTPGEGRHPASLTPAPWHTERSRPTAGTSCFAPAGPVQHLDGRTLKSPHGDPEGPESSRAHGGPGPGYALKVKACRNVRLTWPLRDGTKQTWASGGGHQLCQPDNTQRKPKPPSEQTPSSDRQRKHAGSRKATARV